MAIVLVMLSMACQSLKVEKTVEQEMPELYFPCFPLAENIIDNQDGTCTVPSDWLIRLEVYHILITETESVYNELKGGNKK